MYYLCNLYGFHLFQSSNPLVQQDIKVLSEFGPVTVNLYWSLGYMQSLFGDADGDPFDVLKEAVDKIHQEDIKANYLMANS